MRKFILVHKTLRIENHCIIPKWKVQYFTSCKKYKLYFYYPMLKAIPYFLGVALLLGSIFQTIFPYYKPRYGIFFMRKLHYAFLSIMMLGRLNNKCLKTHASIALIKLKDFLYTRYDSRFKIFTNRSYTSLKVQTPTL